MTGTILVRLAFAATLVSGILYLVSRRNEAAAALQFARNAFQASVFFVLAFCLYFLYLILTHQFQYTYVWNYSATTLPTPLLISTFYAGQEGSFSLWVLYTALLGIFLLSYTARRGYEKDVMSVWCLIQGALLAMLIIKNPFEMIWDSFPAELVHTGPLVAGTPNTVWLDKAKGIWAQFPAEGKGLNPLLQNYWMVIHPQILFTGFTAMAVPYAFAVAGLMRRDYTGWIRTAKPWLIYGAATLGTGIILGGYWAYETLGWGGYWGWDPVENSSLIPWLVSIAAIHTFMSQNQSGTYVRTNIVLSMACFLTVMYSTFLTRSGVLGETSVHSFVDPGMWAYWFLLGFIALFSGLGAVLLARRWREIPVVKASHSVYSREFALFLGAFTICFAAAFILIGTSSPIITAIWKGRASAVDIAYYVKTTLPLGIVVAILAGFGQTLWWRSSKSAGLMKSLLWPSITTLAFTAAIVVAGVRDPWMVVFSAASAFALFVNLQVGYRVFRGNPRFTGGAIAHIGLALLFLGFVSSAKYDDKQTVSLEKGKPVRVLDRYTLTYLGSKPVSDERFGFEVKLDHEDRTFSVVPTMHVNRMDNTTLRHPDILNMYTRDFYLTPLSVEEAGKPAGTEVTILRDASAPVGVLSVKFLGFGFDDEQREKMMNGGEFSIDADLEVAGPDGSAERVRLSMRSRGGQPEYTTAVAPASGATLTLRKIQPNNEDPSKSSVDVLVRLAGDSEGPRRETLVAEASVKPYINLVWVGTVTLIVGFAVTIVRRVRESGLTARG